MSHRFSSRAYLWASSVLLLAVLLVSQFVGTATLGSDARTSAGRLVGQAGFAYIGGLRTFVAAVLWNRIDPIFHEFYQVRSRDRLKFALPSLRAVTLLDPHFVQAYYVASWVVAKNGSYEEGLGIAREGIKNNPKSGLMRANLVNVLMIDGTKKNMPEMLRQTKIGLSDDMVWASDGDRFEGLAIFKTILELNDEKAAAARLDAEMRWLKSNGRVAQDHDHDGDGVQDH